MKWKNSNFFKLPYYSEGKFDFSSAKNMYHCKFVSADTETKLYCKNRLLSEEVAYKLYKSKKQKWFKSNVEVRGYAFMISEYENFALFQCIEDFITACCMLNVKYVFWYNAKFDFNLFDYYFLSNNWKNSDMVVDEKEVYGKITENTYQDLCGDFGQRYSMTIWNRYTNTKYKKVIHKFKMIDVCNIFGGGLRKNLEDWDIRDVNNNPIRKLEMDYVDGTIEEDLQYMINDTKGLFYLGVKIDETLNELTGYSFLKGEFLTAGGLAKKTLLKYMFGQKYDNDNIDYFKKYFPITVEEDKDYRLNSLYQGGKCTVNPYYRGKPVENIFKYDVNSMYPDKMRNMAYPFGNGIKMDNFPVNKDDYVYIVKISNLFGELKDNMIPIWQNALTGDFVEHISEIQERYIWYDELEEYNNWYDMNYDIEEIIAFKKCYPKGVKLFVDKFYDVKKNGKGTIRNGAKLLLNSAYGKIAQRIERVFSYHELAQEGYVRLVSGNVKIDDKSMLSIIVGSRITATSRIALCKYIRDICGNVRKNFLYCDTDSVHALCEYKDCDNYELGKMKNEGVYEKALYLAPKTYLLYDKGKYEVHCKGVNTDVVAKQIKDSDFNTAIKIFAPNITFKCLCSLNVIGGKALLYVDKMIVNEKNVEKLRKEQGDLEDE